MSIAHELARRAGYDRHGDQASGVPSTAAIGGHPIHPMLIPFPLAFLSATLATDLAYLRTRNPFWAEASRWMLRAGLASGAAAGVFGAVDYVTIHRAHRSGVGKVHALGNMAAMALAAANLAARHDDPEGAVEGRGVALSGAVAALLGLTGWAGGELSYRHGVGVSSSHEQPPLVGAPEGRPRPRPRTHGERPRAVAGW
ncbi:DUF2231 domain-containing protein [Arenibaculum pallidiluteum]|uniref:DUF2231 domain-containing protein n=1 Tax=Arenibaculum pallidiluteum TaxID=2812559 RepID=UPI001A96D409|nr:DUF2231 domain-containing protein [Arenibaculum pallidiluteum]